VKFQKSSSGNYLLALLFAVSVINFLDRQILSIVQEDVKVDLSLTDSQLGFLALAFGLVHALFALPIGRIADRVPRKGVLVVCLTVWSSITALGGLVANYSQLVLVRMGVALGEAGVTPTAYSMISDKFPVKRRAFAMAICNACIPIGLMFSLLLGGLIADNFGWRWAFVLFGVPGIFVALLLAFTVKAPERGESDGIKQIQQTDFVATLKHLLTTPTFLFVLLGSATKSVAAQGVGQWIPTYYIRKFDLSMGEVGATLGPLFGITGLIGLLIASYLADRLSQRDIRWYAWIVAGSNALVFPFLIVSLLAGEYLLSLLFFSVSLLSGNAMLAISNALVQSTAPVQMRGMASAMKTTMLSFVGFGLGGTLTGVLSDVFSTDDPSQGLMISLMIVGSAHLVAAVLFMISARTLQRDVDAARAASEGATTEA
jgi:MFS family permease